MANFNTHLFIASTGSSSAALYAANQQLINWVDMPWLVFMGSIGGLLPDIDSDNSKQVKIIFLLLAILSTFTVLFGESFLSDIPQILPAHYTACHIDTTTLSRLFSSFAGKCISYSLLIQALAIFIGVRYILLSVFKSLTAHRGIFHSLLAAVFFTLLTTNISIHLFQQTILFSWLNGLFIGLGFVTHLLLDEVYSVDISNIRIKRSFGTAFKLYSYKNGYTSTLMLICTLALYSLIPSAPF